MKESIVVVTYAAGDGATFSFDVDVPVAAGSKEAVLEAFEAAMAAYEPGGHEFFSVFGQTFEYRHFVFAVGDGSAEGRAGGSYDSLPPTVRTVDEWLAESLERSEGIRGGRPDAVFVVADAASAGDVPGM